MECSADPFKPLSDLSNHFFSNDSVHANLQLPKGSYASRFAESSTAGAFRNAAQTTRPRDGEHSAWSAFAAPRPRAQIANSHLSPAHQSPVASWLRSFNDPGQSSYASGDFSHEHAPEADFASAWSRLQLSSGHGDDDHYFADIFDPDQDHEVEMFYTPAGEEIELSRKWNPEIETHLTALRSMASSPALSASSYASEVPTPEEAEQVCCDSHLCRSRSFTSLWLGSRTDDHPDHFAPRRSSFSLSQSPSGTAKDWIASFDGYRTKGKTDHSISHLDPSPRDRGRPSARLGGPETPPHPLTFNPDPNAAWDFERLFSRRRRWFSGKRVRPDDLVDGNFDVDPFTLDGGRAAANINATGPVTVTVEELGDLPSIELEVERRNRSRERSRERSRSRGRSSLCQEIKPGEDDAAGVPVDALQTGAIPPAVAPVESGSSTPKVQQFENVWDEVERTQAVHKTLREVAMSRLDLFKRHLGNIPEEDRA